VKILPAIEHEHGGVLADLADGFRAMMSAYPTGVAIVTSLDADGIPRGMTCSSLTSVSLAPPTLLVCLDSMSRTLRAIHERGEFALNLLHANGRPAAEIFAAAGGADRFSRIPWEPSPSSGMPWLTGHSHAHTECHARDFYPVGDHEVVIGTVTRTACIEHVPLLYGQRQYSFWSSQPPPTGQ
jgi:flavin reductase (DIM6/NTAB) family NADH-FMN oxidoreductase RutF